MNNTNKELLNKVIEMKLNGALAGGDNERELLEDALSAIDKAIELEKIENSKEVELKKIETEIKVDTSKTNKEAAIKCIELVASVAILPIIEHASKKAFAKMLCEFEVDYSFTTTAGKSLAKIFKF